MKKKSSGNLPQALFSGFAGSIVLTLLHENARHIAPEIAPRMDILGMRALRKILDKADAPQPDRDTLFNVTMASDILTNGLYYSFIGSGKGVWQRGALLGLAAGVGGVVLPGPLGLGEAPSNRTPQTKLMTVAWYLVGGLAAAGASRLWSKARK
ncbi:hypothetical protein [Hymenobacter cavernae]|uniref:DUF1440 domain-containing protein n=1 Tax=Hymenobacter cavernae TaxID=2044852 RepID=A0ABQ1UFZ5_9BACT|nr:hypothetical protein [Hymenobacter cavernae]GGF16456.1 hypothetical protein GCM10011383_29840 [Hymenobacter cavernae]